MNLRTGENSSIFVLENVGDMKMFLYEARTSVLWDNMTL